MNLKVLHFLVALTFFIAPFKVVAQAVNVQDSLALVDFYHRTSNVVLGPGDTLHVPWQNETNWLTVAPVSTWYGVTLNNGRVSNLVLNNNGLIGGAIPVSMTNLSKLTDLELSNCYLEDTLPSSMGNLSELTTLYLDHNHLRGSIPSSFAGLTKLQRLRLNANLEMTIGAFPEVLNNLTELNDLEMNYTGITGSIPSSIGNLSKLSYLDLSHNYLISGFPSSLGNCKALSYAAFYSNSLSGHIPQPIQILPNVVNGTIYLLLGDNNFTFDAFEELATPSVRLLSGNQKNIPITSGGNLLSVSAGGTLSNDSFFLYKDSVLYKTQVGDSVFKVTNTGNYYLEIRDVVTGTNVTLFSDTATVVITLADTSTTVTQNITGSLPIDINNSIYKLVTLTPTAGANSISGNVTTMVTIDSMVSMFHSLPYVQRHYDITPAVNAANAQATVALYFTQQDFDNFNDYVTSNNIGIPLLPTGGVNSGSVRIIQFHGSFTASPDPGNYDDSTTVFITPNVVWDNVNNWWVVTFPVDGFSGFFLSTANFTLPLTLLEFKGELQEDAIALQWRTTNEVTTKEFIIERSINGNIFNDIGQVATRSGSAINQYNFLDINPLPGNNFYRLKMIDIDGKFAYSTIVYIKTNNAVFKSSVYPNPANNISTLLFTTDMPSKYLVEIADPLGKIIKRVNGVSGIGVNKVDLVVRDFAPGTYFVTLIEGENRRHSLKLSKQ